MKTTNKNNEVIDLETLISNLKSEDNRNQKILNQSKLLMWGVVALYSIMIIIQLFNTLNFLRTIGTACIIIAFIILAWGYKKSSETYQHIDYGLPILDLLRNVVKRFTFSKNQIFQKQFIFFFIGFLLTVIGFNLLIFNDLGFLKPINRIIVVTSAYLFLLGLGGLSGFFIWYKRQKPLRDSALQLISEIES